MTNGVVTEIEEGSLAEASGLQPADVVLEFNRQYVKNFSTLQRLADPHKPTDFTLFFFFFFFFFFLLNRRSNVMYITIQGE